MLDSHAKERFARHLLLSEIGERGQEKLSNASFRVEGGSLEAQTAREYLLRAGLRETREAPSESSVIRASQRRSIATYEHAIAALEGAHNAVEVIKNVLSLGTPSRIVRDLLAPETSNTGHPEGGTRA